MFICMYEDYAGEGKTLKEAFEELRTLNADAEAEECAFYEATRIEVEVVIQKKDVKNKSHHGNGFVV